jgi:outer membrane receptor protein involved in Fe transport
LSGTGFVARTDESGAIAIVRVKSSGVLEPGEAIAGSAAAAIETASVQDIVVTAQKREERLIDAPQSVSVLSSEDLSKLSATQFRDFANTVPGLSFESAGAGQTQITLRGVTSGWDVSSTVGVYVDDVPYGSSSAFAQGSSIALDVGLFDIDRIEILRGPQGTIYGASTLGGLIKYVTHSPRLGHTEGSMRAGLASTQHGGLSYDGSAALNVPLGDTAAVRASGYYSHDGGYIDNIELGDEDVNRADIYGGRLDLLFEPVEALSVRLTAFAQNVSRSGTAVAEYTLDGQPVAGDLDQRRWLQEPFDQEFRLISGTIAYDFGIGTATSITSYQTMKANAAFDYTPIYVPIFNSDTSVFGGPYSAVGLSSEVFLKKFTEEARVSSDGRRKLEWLFGAFYTRETVSSDEFMDLRGVDGQVISPENLYLRSNPTMFEEAAAFANLTYRFSDKFDIGAGIRLARNNQRSEVIGQGLFALSTPEGKSHETVATYLADARYHLSKNATVYGRFATGYRPGGPNSINYDPTTGQPFGLPTFDADELKSYELGFKAQTRDRRLGVDAAVYYIDWKNIQIIAVRNGFGVVANAPEAHIKGAELSMFARPVRGLDLTGGFAYQDARLAEDAPDLAGVDGERLPTVPKFTAAITADYTILGNDLYPSFGVTLRHVTDRSVAFGRASGADIYQLPAYTTVDLRSGIILGEVDLRVFIRNIIDARAQVGSRTYATPSAAAPVQVTILQPRTVGVNASYHF